MNYIKENIKIRKKSIENELETWKERKKIKLTICDYLEKDFWGNRIIGHIESLEFCLKQINELLKLDCVNNK